jgi:threonylcarbamoyladenosine tRNA methylthiotransferase MtaB
MNIEDIRLNRLNPEAVVIATGCYAQLEPEKIAESDQVDMVVGIRDKFKITDFLPHIQRKGTAEIHACETEAIEHFDPAYSTGERTRAFLKIQDGCDYVCTYCTIPKARGVSRSDTLENILNNAREIAAKGIKEIVLTGVNIGDYGKGEKGDKSHAHTFLDLIKALDEVEGLARIRISSIEPNLLTNDIIDFVATSKRFVPHFHIPLQSGSDVLLKSMKRRYATDLYRRRVDYIREILPEAAIGVDVIVGFPGETNELFMQTYKFIESMDISYLHVFTYSERPGTEAMKYDGKVPLQERNKRSKMLRALSLQKKSVFYDRQRNKVLRVLFEAENKDGFLYGFTDNYVRVKIPYNAGLSHTLQQVELSGLDNDAFIGVLK